MKRASALLPYAVASAAVLVGSLAALGASVRTGLAPAPSASASAAARAGLSDTGRLAYWRPGTGGALELWVGDLDGGRRWRAVTEPARSEVSLTRWSPDGSALAYTLSGAGLGLARLDGEIGWIPLPPPLRGSTRLVSFEWSPDATRIAATLRGGNGFGDESDVWLADARGGASWERLTSIGRAFAGRWIDDGRLFVETTSGLVAILEVATGALRPLTGMPATSAMVGRDGRVRFTGGASVQPPVVGQPFGGDRVWSATIDGDDLRAETSEPVTQMRVFGVLADGRSVAGVPGGLYFVGTDKTVLAFGSGTVRKVAVSDDGRRVIGFTDSRALLIDPSKTHAVPGQLPPASAATVLIAGIGDGDAWFPRASVPLAHAAAPERPRERWAFTLGGLLWLTGADGRTRAVASSGRGYLSPPARSPSGDRTASVDQWSGNVEVIVAGGDQTARWTLPGYAEGPAWWDGDTLAFWRAGPFVATATGQVRGPYTTELYAASTGAKVGETAGRVRPFADGRRLVLTDGDPPPRGGEARLDQRVLVESGAAARVVTDARRLAVAQTLARVDPSAEAAIEDVVPSADGDYVGVRVSLHPGNTVVEAFYALVRIADGAMVWAHWLYGAEGPWVGDVELSPAGHLVAWTEMSRAQPRAVRAFLADPLSGRVIVEAAGTFGGWAPDGRSVYVARNEGLFAYPIAGGPPLRVSAIGVPVAAAAP